MLLEDSLFTELLNKADESPRKRTHFLLHTSPDEAVQRFLVAMKQGSYVRPHLHSQDNKWELIIPLKGSLSLIVFSIEGKVIEKCTLAPGSAVTGKEIPPGQMHCLYPETEEAVFIEIKQGPYTPAVESDFAAWAPKEGEADAEGFQSWCEKAQPGDQI